MTVTLAVLCGFCLDILLGDPEVILHPVVIIGRCVSELEKILRNLFPKNNKGELAAGLLCAIIIPAGVFAISGAVCFISYKINKIVYFVVQTFWCWQCLAVKGLKTESRRVYKNLEDNDIMQARKSVARIVGRDTENLSEEGVIKAVVETVAENFSDGVAAPMMYMLIGGAPLALCYKSINTMDSMIGYKNERYLYYGRAAAKLDDIANYIPSRIAAIIWIISAFFTGNDAKNSFRMWKRDSRNHPSPNSAQTEAACAGALGVQLAGPAYYFGKLYDKPNIGDKTREIKINDIIETIKMLYCASVIALIFGLAIRTGIIFIIGGI